MAHRTQITLADDQYELLLAESRRMGVALAELVRRAIDHMFGTVGAEEATRALTASFGGWAERGGDGDGDGADYVERRRRGLGHRLGDS